MAGSKKKIMKPTPKPAFVPGKPGKATRPERSMGANELRALIDQRERRPYDPKDLKRLEGQPIRREKGGAVPSEYKGFSKLPEAVQTKMDPVAAKKYKKGGAVCRGGRSAERGTQFRGVR